MGLGQFPGLSTMNCRSSRRPGPALPAGRVPRPSEESDQVGTADITGGTIARQSWPKLLGVLCQGPKPVSASKPRTDQPCDRYGLAGGAGPPHRGGREESSRREYDRTCTLHAGMSSRERVLSSGAEPRHPPRGEPSKSRDALLHTPHGGKRFRPDLS